ncbi:MAG: hypothetical protein R2856_13885 [Caldilineaceae bacterium]
MKPVKAAVLYQTVRDTLSHSEAAPKAETPAKAVSIWQDIAENRHCASSWPKTTPLTSAALRMLERMGYR